jgi:AcrR family transcriptional regulator
MMAANASPDSASGRPRDPRVEAAILSAARDLLAENGYYKVTIEAIAKRAGVGRPTVYRRWPAKPFLVYDAVFPAPEGAIYRRTGEFEADIRAAVAGTFAFFGEPAVMSAVPGILAEWQDDPELRGRLAGKLEQAARTEFRALIEEGIAQGVARPGIDADIIFDLITAAALYAVQFRDVPDAGDHEEAVCALVLANLGVTE